MKQCQFLGRSPLSAPQRFALTQATSFRRHGFTQDVIIDHLQRMGLSPEAAHDPDAFREELLRDLRSMPDLPDTLAAAGAPSRLIDDVQQFGELVARQERPLRLDRVEIDQDGRHFQVTGYHDGSLADVNEGDSFCGGVSVQGNAGTGSVSIAPRLVRVLCLNGQVQLTDETGDVCSFRRDSEGRIYGDMEVAVEAGFSRQSLDAVTERMRRLQRRRAHDPVDALTEEGARLPAWAFAPVRRIFDENGDPSVYGAFNALTQAARDAHTVAERLRLEVTAGRLAFARPHAANRFA